MIIAQLSGVSDGLNGLLTMPESLGEAEALPQSVQLSERF
jgi:hypothetical protein